MWIKVGDTVEVKTGDDSGVRAKVVSVDRENGKVTVEGVNRVYKHVRRSQRNPQGGRLSMEMPVRLSNVALVCNKCNRGVRTGARFRDDGTKVMFCRKCGSEMSVIAPARARYAKKG